MMICGCDFGLRNSGIVILDKKQNLIEPNLIQTKRKGAARLVEVETAFEHIIKNKELIFFIEGYAYGARYQRESLAELGGVIRRYFFLNNLDFWTIPPNTLKLFVTGSGRASKNYMKKCTKNQWNVAFKSNDVCDAYGLARLGTHVYNRDVAGLTDEQKYIVLDILENEDSYLNTSTAKKQKKRNERRKTKTKG